MLEKTVCELFAGVGGFRLGLEKTNEWKVIWANQWEPSMKVQHAFDCYTKHFETGIHINDDIAKVATSEIPTHTLLVGGFPCQDYSVARTQAKGIEGKKGVLWWEIQRIVKDKQPPFLLLENVDRLLKSPAKQRGRDFGIILGCLSELGYNVEWRVINAADYGYPQKRRRIFIFGFKNNTNYSTYLKTTTFHNWIYKAGFFASAFPVEEPMFISMFDKSNMNMKKDIVDISDNFSYEFGNAGIMNSNGDFYTQKVQPIPEPEFQLKNLLESNVDEKYYLDQDSLEKWTYMKGSKREIRKSKSGYEYNYTEGAVPFPDDIEKPARTMLTSEGSKNRSTHVVLDPGTNRLRILTPTEAERINCFPDDWTNTGMPEKFRYFCMGNALVVGVIERMGDTLSKIVDGENLNKNLKDIDEMSVPLSVIVDNDSYTSNGISL